MHVIVIIKQYPRDFHVTIVPRARSGYALSDMPPKRAAASKKKEFVWTDDERSGRDPFLLRVTRWPINHVTIG